MFAIYIEVLLPFVTKQLIYNVKLFDDISSHKEM